MPTRNLWLVILAVAAAAPAAARAQQPTTSVWRDAIPRARGATAVRRSVARAAASNARAIAESEPNNTVQTADSVALGDQATGVVNPAGDVDTWFVDVPAGQVLSVDVDADALGAPLDATLELLAPDGITVLAFNDDFDGFDSRITFPILSGGRYYIAVRGFGASGGPLDHYQINVGTLTCGVVGTEHEPNDTPGTASRVAIGDSASGELCPVIERPAGDVDTWAFTAPAGTTIELDVDAAALGALVDPILALYASDGTTQLAFNDDQDGADSRLQYSITTAGTYYATVADRVGAGSNPYPYLLHVRAITPGPGDPIVVRATDLGIPLGLAVGSTGDAFVGDVIGNRVLRVSRQGVVTTFAAGIQSPLGLAFDAFGALLVVSGDGAVYRVSPQGQATRFITDAGVPFWIAVAPDGRLWLSDVSDRSLRRYSATGQFETRVDASAVGGSGPGPVAIGPAGEPFFSQGTEIWKLGSGGLQRVVQSPRIIWAFAFDAVGDIYAPAPAAGRISLYDATGRALADPFAVGPDAPQAVAFGRDSTGAMAARVFATEPRVGQLIEVNPAGVVHPGLPPGYVPPPLTLEAAVASLLGDRPLSAADVQYLDGLGNRNGRYDVGDLQAYLRVLGTLPGGAATGAAPRPRSNR